MFGGKTVEHEVSVISGIQAIMAVDTDKYEVIPVYLTKDNDMYTGSDIGDISAYKDIPALLKRSQRVILVNEGGKAQLVPYPPKMFGPKPVQIDIAFPVVHGTNVEDGALQGYLKTAGVPFVGPDVTSSAISMDKFITKAVLKEAGVPVLDAEVYTLADYAKMDELIDDAEKVVGYPIIVKPVNLGSSVGIGVAKNREEFIQALDDAFMYATRVLVEHAITKLREINCSVLGDENEAEASECEEPLTSGEILSYEDKYVNGGGGKKGGSKGGSGSKGAGMANLSRKIPAQRRFEDRLHDRRRDGEAVFQRDKPYTRLALVLSLGTRRSAVQRTSRPDDTARPEEDEDRRSPHVHIRHQHTGQCEPRRRQGRQKLKDGKTELLLINGEKDGTDS